MLNKLSAFILFLCLSHLAMAQKEWSVFGHVQKYKNGQPVEGVTVTNLRSGRVVVTNDEGDFYTRAAVGDSLKIDALGFATEKFYWTKALGDFITNLKESAISLDEIIVKDKRSQTLEKEIKAFLDNPENGATMKLGIKRNIVRPTAAGGLGGGAGISIDALYELWSKEGKNRRKVADLEYQDLKKFYTELRFNKNKVANITGLKDPELNQFMKFCKLSDDFILEATDYDLTYTILRKLKEFRSKTAFPSLN
ncbi:carboxypeptidase-like regulatory domain-containing protein [Marinilongibacter aquaticus]|uniref:carboxypeptidase-like regulatory domain-containing protein n=1 Tax=Marinilongibacter aquaticus TaxID=2975157 RepID=UPI0021BD5CC3|nr:carboxypeptidase-like regulatory domain-containing protein [Marinilongibacter aquaticus]UBM57306.1 carboxypeptidase-like regulatory domain-containing protein [Marinilongibacter aquaticus]